MKHLITAPTASTKKEVNKLINNFQFDEAAHVLLRLHHHEKSPSGPDFLSEEEIHDLFEKLSEGSRSYKKFMIAMENNSTDDMKVHGEAIVKKVFDKKKNKKHGGKISKSITRKTSFLVNDHGTVGPSKFKKCQANNIPVVGEDHILELVRKNSNEDSCSSINSSNMP